MSNHSPDILDQIIEQRLKDLSKYGPSLGCTIPSERNRPVVPFLEEPGAILEIKRASPSRGDIAPNLDPIQIAGQYRSSGAKNISVLTEQHFFKGSLDDLVAVSTAYQDISFLRKDFILGHDEIETSYMAGADAVLLIARILPEDKLTRLAKHCHDLGITPFIEVRDDEDIAKLRAAAQEVPVACGINSRDLSTFKTDPLVPAALLGKMPGPAVYESGVLNAGSAVWARRLGFAGLLVGEGVAKTPDQASKIVDAFAHSRPDSNGLFWRKIAERRTAIRKKHGEKRPLVKICGLTQKEDALLAAELGADLLGFVCASSPRQANTATITETVQALRQQYSESECPLCVAVITDLQSQNSRDALQLAFSGIVDAIQYHGADCLKGMTKLDTALCQTENSGKYGCGRYLSVGISNQDDVQDALDAMQSGEPRVLCDTKIEGKSGGTGQQISAAFSSQLSQNSPLWLAGGLSPDNIAGVIERLQPELVDASSQLESEPGKKDHELLRRFFKEL